MQMQDEASGHVSPAAAAARRTAARRNSPAFYQSLNHAAATLIGVARCVFGDPKTRPVAGRSGRGETPLDTPARGKKRAAGMNGATEKSTGGKTRGPAQSPADHGGARRNRTARRHPWRQ